MNNGFLFPPLKALPCIPDFRIFFFLKRQVSAALQKKNVCCKNNDILFISQKAVTHAIWKLGMNGHSKIKLSDWSSHYNSL